MYIVQAGGGAGFGGVAPKFVGPQNPIFSIGNHLLQDEATIPTHGSAVWPVANQAIAVPFWVPTAFVWRLAFWQNGTVAAGNVEVGVYTSAFAKLDTTGSIAQTGTSVVQTSAPSSGSVTLTAGNYYLWMSASDATATFIRDTVGSSVRTAGMGCFQQTSVGPGSAPNPAVPVTIVSAYMPIFGITTETSF